MGERAAQVVVTTDRFDDDLAELTDRYGFRVEQIFPADAPSTAVISRDGTTLRLEAGVPARPVELRLSVASRRGPVRLPGGTRIVFTVDDSTIDVPPCRPTLAIRHHDGDASPGRAGMRYHDLIPDRWGGRYIASIISIPDGGPVPDYVHYHRVRFQMIAVKRGWAKVVYEGQGEPFVMHAGDVVTQPPGIRHRVLEASPGLEVVEVSCPAEHETIADWSHVLPDEPASTDRTWDGQRFVRHVHADAAWVPGRLVGWEACDTGIAAGTEGDADVRIVRPSGAGTIGDDLLRFDSEFALVVVLDGSVQFIADGRPAVLLTDGSSVAVPADLPHRFLEPSPDCLMLVVTVPARRR
ncbi:MAG: cupin [Acidimicrobiaceae bacterium]|nr:cupin [Acidimicrobiaceae bacterium]